MGLRENNISSVHSRRRVKTRRLKHRNNATSQQICQPTCRPDRASLCVKHAYARLKAAISRMSTRKQLVCTTFWREAPHSFRARAMFCSTTAVCASTSYLGPHGDACAPSNPLPPYKQNQITKAQTGFLSFRLLWVASKQIGGLGKREFVWLE